jgi:WD40 repeat protein
MALAQDFSLAVAQDATSIRVYELESGTLVKDLRAYGYSAEEAVVSNDGQHILLGRKQSSAEPDQKDIQLWQVDELSPRMVRLRVSRDVTLYDFAPDRNLALGGNDKGEILLFSTETGREHRRFYVRGIKEFEKARLSPNGKLIGLLGSDAKDKRVAFVVSSDDGKVKLSLKGRDNRNGVMASVGGNDTSDFVTSMAFSADGAKFAVGRWNGTVELWTMDKFQRTKVLPQGDKESLDQILALVFSQDGQFLLGGSRDSGVFMWDLPKNRFVRTFQRGDDLAGHVHFESVAMSQDGRLVAGGLVQHAFSSGDTGAESGIKVWDARDGKLLFILRGHAGGIGALTFSANDRWIISGSYDGTIRYWDRTTGKWIATFTAAQDGRWMKYRKRILRRLPK